VALSQQRGNGESALYGANGFSDAKVLHCQLPNCLLRLAGGFHLAQLGSKDGAAALKHNGSEGRIGPAAGSPYQTLLSELPRS